jgi:hypothetical protein
VRRVARDTDGACVGAHLFQRDDLGVLIVGNARVAVDSQVEPGAGSVVGEELALLPHPVEPRLAMRLPVESHATARPDLISCLDPDSVRKRAGGAQACMSLSAESPRVPTCEAPPRRGRA